MSKINFNDVEFYFDDEDEVADPAHEVRASKRQKTRIRRKIENLIERKKWKEFVHTEDSYWGD